MKLSFANLNMIPIQTIFDIAARHLLTQKAKSRGTYRDGCTDGCLYRGPNGLMCAVGPFIAEEEYQPTLEGSNAFDVCEILNPNIDFTRQYLLKRLQQIHDEVYPVYWKAELAAMPEYLSRRYMPYQISLSLAVLNEFPD